MAGDARENEHRTSIKVRRRRSVLLPATAVLAAACAHVSGVRFDEATLQSLEVGRTSQSDIVSRFGAPSQKMINVNNDWHYYDPKCGERSAPVDVFVYNYWEQGIPQMTTTLVFSGATLCKKVSQIAGANR